MKVLMSESRNLHHMIGGVVDCLRRNVSNLVKSTRVGSNPVGGTTDHK